MQGAENRESILSAEDYYHIPRVNLTGAVNDEMVKDLDRQIKSIDIATETPLVVALSTPGGFVSSARTIYDELHLLQELATVHLVARGACMSAGVTIAMAVPLERRLATPRTKFLIHEAQLMNSPHITGPLRARRQEFEMAKTDIEDDIQEAHDTFRLIAKGCGQPKKRIEKVARSGLYLKGQAAVDFGLISGFIGNRHTQSKQSTPRKKSSKK